MKPVYLLDTNVISEFTKPFSNKNLIKKVSETLDCCAICSTVWQETVPYSDSQIAATAIANNMILVTHNTEDFLPLVQNSILHVEDWWEEE